MPVCQQQVARMSAAKSGISRRGLPRISFHSSGLHGAPANGAVGPLPTALRAVTLPRFAGEDESLVIARSVSDEAIQILAQAALDCFASLAMTNHPAAFGSAPSSAGLSETPASAKVAMPVWQQQVARMSAAKSGISRRGLPGFRFTSGLHGDAGKWRRRPPPHRAARGDPPPLRGRG